jgi:PadR family transcriptional regulator, regulatory protein PadR
MNIAPWLSQLRKGAAELDVLSIVKSGERYGLQILEPANQAGDIVADGALYPLLNRLEKDGKLASRWVLEDGPHPRKYYRLTAEGGELLDLMVSAWVAFREAMSSIVETR